MGFDSFDTYTSLVSALSEQGYRLVRKRRQCLAWYMHARWRTPPAGSACSKASASLSQLKSEVFSARKARVLPLSYFKIIFKQLGTTDFSTSGVHFES